VSRSALNVQEALDLDDPEHHSDHVSSGGGTRADEQIAARIAQLEQYLAHPPEPQIPQPHAMINMIEAALTRPRGNTAPANRGLDVTPEFHLDDLAQDDDLADERPEKHREALQIGSEDSNAAQRNGGDFDASNDDALHIMPPGLIFHDNLDMLENDSTDIAEDGVAKAPTQNAPSTQDTLSRKARSDDAPYDADASQPQTIQDNDPGMAHAMLATAKTTNGKPILVPQEIITLRHDVRPELAIMIRAASVVLMMLLVIVFSRTATAEEHSNIPTPGTISVTGTGHVTSPPDLAIIDSGVVTSAPAARDAVHANTDAMAAMVSRLKDMGIADRDLQTSGFSINPQYQHFRPREGQPAPPPKIVSYEVRNMLTVRIRDLEATGAILDAIVSDGANQMNGITFTIDDSTSLMQTARERAVADARARAEVLTEGLGVSLGRVLSISEGRINRPTPQPRMARMEMAMVSDSAPVPVEAGEQQLTATVSVTWELDQ
jgi:uncharacterized protein YggE